MTDDDLNLLHGNAIVMLPVVADKGFGFATIRVMLRRTILKECGHDLEGNLKLSLVPTKYKKSKLLE